MIKKQEDLYKDWSTDAETAVEEESDPLRDFPRYGQPPKAGVWEKKIIFAGTDSLIHNMVDILKVRS
ncbi:MAG: hypothetical protein ABS938_07010 [Psychrobacillus psychrodurans]